MNFKGAEGHSPALTCESVDREFKNENEYTNTMAIVENVIGNY